MPSQAAVARTVIGVIGNVISFGLFFSPAPTFWKIHKKKAVEDFKPDPYLATLLNCAFWVFYGIVHPNSTLVWTINGIGLVFEVFYLALFLYYATNAGRKKVGLWLVIEAVFFGIIVACALLVPQLHSTRKRSLMVGIICDIFNIAMYVSPLTIMKQVITTKSVEYMPFWLSVANFLNGCCWTIYALIHPFDIFVLISNGIGVLSGIVQLVLYAWFYFYGKNKDDDKTVEIVSKPTQIDSIV